MDTVTGIYARAKKALTELLNAGRPRLINAAIREGDLVRVNDRANDQSLVGRRGKVIMVIDGVAHVRINGRGSDLMFNPVCLDLQNSLGNAKEVRHMEDGCYEARHLKPGIVITRILSEVNCPRCKETMKERRRYENASSKECAACGKPAQYICEGCGKPTCKRHAEEVNGNFYCRGECSLNAEAHQNAEPSIEQGMKVLKCKCGHSMSDHHETGAGVCETCDCQGFVLHNSSDPTKAIVSREPGGRYYGDLDLRPLHGEQALKDALVRMGAMTREEAAKAKYYGSDKGFGFDMPDGGYVSCRTDYYNSSKDKCQCGHRIANHYEDGEEKGHCITCPCEKPVKAVQEESHNATDPKEVLTCPCGAKFTRDELYQLFEGKACPVCMEVFENSEDIFGPRCPSCNMNLLKGVKLGGKSMWYCSECQYKRPFDPKEARNSSLQNSPASQAILDHLAMCNQCRAALKQADDAQAEKDMCEHGRGLFKESLKNSAKSIARWESGRGKHWIELFVDEGGYTYKGDGCSGVMGKFDSDQAAIDKLDKDVHSYLMPDAAKIIKRVNSLGNASPSTCDYCDRPEGSTKWYMKGSRVHGNFISYSICAKCAPQALRDGFWLDPMRNTADCSACGHSPQLHDAVDKGCTFKGCDCKEMTNSGEIPASSLGSQYAISSTTAKAEEVSCPMCKSLGMKNSTYTGQCEFCGAKGEVTAYKALELCAKCLEEYKARRTKGGLANSTYRAKKQMWLGDSQLQIGSTYDVTPRSQGVVRVQQTDLPSGNISFSLRDDELEFAVKQGALVLENSSHSDVTESTKIKCPDCNTVQTYGEMLSYGGCTKKGCTFQLTDESAGQMPRANVAAPDVSVPTPLSKEAAGAEAFGNSAFTEAEKHVNLCDDCCLAKGMNPQVKYLCDEGKRLIEATGEEAKDFMYRIR